MHANANRGGDDNEAYFSVLVRNVLAQRGEFMKSCKRFKFRVLIVFSVTLIILINIYIIK